MPDRTATIERKTAETDVRLTLEIDGTGESTVSTGVPFFDHMLSLFAKHGLFDLEVAAEGDIDVDAHHVVEDVGICIGQAVNQALGDKSGIARYGAALVPMDEALVLVALDLSGRGHLQYELDPGFGKVGDFDVALPREFFAAVADSGRLTLHVRQLSGLNAHHIIEAAFKAFGRALDGATQIDSRRSGIPSTKGML